MRRLGDRPQAFAIDGEFRDYERGPHGCGRGDVNSRVETADGGYRHDGGGRRCGQGGCTAPIRQVEQTHRYNERRRLSAADRDTVEHNEDWSDRRWDRHPSNIARSLPTHVRLGSYNGDRCLETFLAKFENMSSYLGWSEKDRLFHLKAGLEGPAGQVLWDTGPQSSVDDVIRLRARFGADDQAERFRAELRARRRQKGEGLQSLYNDICR